MYPTVPITYVVSNIPFLGTDAWMVIPLWIRMRGFHRHIYSRIYCLMYLSICLRSSSSILHHYLPKSLLVVNCYRCQQIGTKPTRKCRATVESGAEKLKIYV